MAVAPHRPEEFRALIIQEDDTFCKALKNLTQLTVMVWRMVKFKWKTDGTGFTDDYALLLNAVICPDPPATLSGETINPEDFRGILLGPTSGFCEMFVKLAVQLSNNIYNWVAFEYDEEGGLSQDYLALLCSVECAALIEATDLSYFFNYEDFAKWDVVANSVDLVGVAPYDPWPGNGMYVDLAGTENADHPYPGSVTPGAIRMKTGVALVNGQSYRVALKVAGGYYQPAISHDVRVRVFLPDNVTAVFDQTITTTGLMPMTSFFYDFVAATTDTVKIQVEMLTAVGAVNVGPKIDDVVFTNLTSGVVLFSDDFEQEGPAFKAIEDIEKPDPDTIKDTIPTSALAVCAKFYRLLKAFPGALYNLISFEYNSSGTGFTDDYATLVCTELQHGIASPAIPVPTGVSASDGAFPTSVFVQWSAVTPQTGTLSGYQVYRASEATTDPNTATLIATTNSLTLQVVDAVAPGFRYRYWVRAVQDGRVSDWSQSDVGFATATPITPTLPSITNLEATQGFYPTTSGFIRLMWTLPAGVDRVFYKFDIYRNTVNDYPSATRIKENAAIATYDEANAADTGIVLENSGTGNDLETRDVIYWHTPPSGSTKYYFWVVLKQVNPSNNQILAISSESNSAVGWVQIGTGDTNPATPVEVTVSGTGITVPVGKTRMRVLMIGAGGSASFPAAGGRGAGGAAGDALMALIPVTPGDIWTWTMPQARGGAGLYVNVAPTNGPTSHIQYEGRASRLAGPTTEVLQAAGGLSAIFGDPSGTAAPANNGTETQIANIVPVEQWIERGKEGQVTGTYGGRGGAAYGFNRPGSAAVSTKNAGTKPATKYSGSSGGSDSTGGSGGNNAVPLMLYTFID
jgi:hypothetical protein